MLPCVAMLFPRRTMRMVFDVHCRVTVPRATAWPVIYYRCTLISQYPFKLIVCFRDNLTLHCIRCAPPEKHQRVPQDMAYMSTKLDETREKSDFWPILLI